MNRLMYYKDELICLFNVGYGFMEALQSVYEEFSNEKWEYPKDLSDTKTQIKQEIKMLNWFKDSITMEVCTNYEKYFDKIIKELKKEKIIDDIVTDLYVEWIVSEGVCTVTPYNPDEDDEENEPITDEEVLNWLCDTK